VQAWVVDIPDPRHITTMLKYTPFHFETISPTQLMPKKMAQTERTRKLMLGTFEAYPSTGRQGHNAFKHHCGTSRTTHKT
jgi:hypothetical protein